MGEDVRHELDICPYCHGDGFHTGHSELHNQRQDLDCAEAGCPVQIWCDYCQATGLMWKKDIKRIRKFEPETEEEDEFDLPF